MTIPVGISHLPFLKPPTFKFFVSCSFMLTDKVGLLHQSIFIKTECCPAETLNSFVSPFAIVSTFIPSMKTPKFLNLFKYSLVRLIIIVAIGNVSFELIDKIRNLIYSQFTILSVAI